MEAIVVVVIFSLVIFVVVRLSRWIARKLGRPRLRYVFSAAFFTWYLWDIPVGYLQLYYLCHLQGEFEPIEDTGPLDAYIINPGNGGCDEVCVSALVDYHIPLVERYIRVPDPKEWTDQVSWYHFRLSNVGDPDCRLYEQHPHLPKQRTLPPGKCLASQPIHENDQIHDWYDVESKSSWGTIIRPYDEIQFLHKEKTSGKIIFIDRLYSVSESRLSRFVSDLFSIPGAGGESCYAESVDRYPFYTKNKGE